MKIINNTNAYVQKKDLDYLINRNLSLPESIILKIHNEITINENNKYEFVEFKNIKEIKYFKSLDWIVDYKQVNKLTENEITDLCKKIADEINELSDKYTSLSNLEKLNSLMKDINNIPSNNESKFDEPEDKKIIDLILNRLLHMKIN